ncbi:hypothetical protein PV08_10229 [Exophiala spinifera]|uniref:Uncharacterized protein n=1 Tax=Exophiala spinifera TaxID=91928 RepID=A0A0D2AWW9_9EURO|nr:uncharacterized protein PV08_10229 [Exophiala spinifera]KIW10930.1 hypothetical protein PV08_10229 [Exophiala spinifera]
MGGLVFREDGLSTPRMPPKVYYHVSSNVNSSEFLSKASHGDVDVVVAEPLNKTQTFSRMDLSAILGAHKSKGSGSRSMFHFAVPWPDQFHSISSDEESLYQDQEMEEAEDALNPNPEPCTANSPDLQEMFCQVDVQICDNEQSFNWHFFVESHGEIWTMLGGIIRHAGLTCSKGLQLRIKEIEPYNKAQARVKLTDDPKLVLDYLGLDIQRYEKPFNSWDEMMAYVATCRFHDPGRWRDSQQWEKEPDQADQDSKSGDGHDTPTPLTKRKHRDRARLNKRPAFRYWIDTYLPARVDDKPGKDAHLSRDEVIEDAKEYFGEDFGRRFDERKAKWTRQIKVDQLWSDIRKSLPIQGAQIGRVMVRMKSDIAGDGGTVTASLVEVREAFREERFSDVLAWATEHWDEVRDRQKRVEVGQ